MTALDPATTASKAWAETARVLREAGIESPVVDARLLVCHALGIDRLNFLRDPHCLIGDSNLALEAAVSRRLAREPVSRIVGERAFFGRIFRVSPATLDPRPDSETLVVAALELAERGNAVRKGQALHMLDLGTGTGCILLTLLAELPAATGVGVDISPEALVVAQENAARLGVADRAKFVVGNWGTELTGPFDLIVSNPPYIRHGDLTGLAPEVIAYDPVLALDGGPEGLDAYGDILTSLPPLAADGAVLFEVGSGQADAVSALLAAKLSVGQFGNSGGISRRWKDLAGTERVVGVAT